MSLDIYHRGSGVNLPGNCRYITNPKSTSYSERESKNAVRFLGVAAGQSMKLTLPSSIFDLEVQPNQVRKKKKKTVELCMVDHTTSTLRPESIDTRAPEFPRAYYCQCSARSLKA
jgi:4-hydroxyphenylpyruvate dioxygenase-like putative hemolysin